LRSLRLSIVLALLFALFAFALLALPARSQAAPAIDAARQPAPPSGHPVLPGIWRLYGNDPLLTTDDDLEPLRPIIGKATFVALGESVHTSGGFYRMKHRVFRFLVEKMGFRVFAFESPWENAEKVARYVASCSGSAGDAVSQGLFGVWDSEEVRELAQWMCDWNRTHRNAKDRLHFFGFDIQQPEDDGPALIAFLQRTGTPEGHRWIEGIQSCEAVTVRHDLNEIPPESHARCIQALKEIDTHFQRNGRTLTRQTSKQDFAIARLQLVGLRAWENAAFLSSRDFPASITARDEAMAYAFLTLRALRFPKARTMIWAANLHVARAALPNGARPMGSFLAAALGRNYLTFALTAYETEVDYPGFFPCGAVDRPAGSVEERLHEIGEEALLVDLGTRNPYLPSGVLPMGTFLLEPYRDFNGLFYLERSAKMHPLRWPSCR